LSAIRFGDGRLGRIPAPGAVIRADYLSTRGLAGNIAAGTRLIIDQKSDQLAPEIRQALQAGAEISLISQTAAGGGQDPTSLAAARRRAHTILTQRWRAVTAADFEALARSIPGCKIARAKCVPERDLSAADPETARTGHVSIIVVPASADPRPTPTTECLAEIYHLLDQRRLIASRHHVLGPAYTNVHIRADIVRRSQIGAESVRQDAAQQLAAFFHPLTGGPPEFNQKGWPFGRDVYISEVYHVLEQAAGVDYVNAVALYFRAHESAEWQAAGQRIQIGPRNLVYFDRSASVITVRTVT
jgi:predicted phage baseplate assembly protein